MNTDTYQLVTDRIIAKLEAGTIPWKHFASSPLAQPKNLVSKRPYRGINHFLLSGSKYRSEFWLTYKQAQDLGGFVKKGEKGELIVLWRFLDVEDRETGETKQIPFLRHYHVFNVEQCEGIDYAKLTGQSPRKSDPIESAERIVDRGPNLYWIKKRQTPDLSKRDPAPRLPFTKCAERRLSPPVEYLIDARWGINKPTM